MRVRHNRQVRLFTVGHSNLQLEPFLAALQTHGIGAIADVRAFPASRRWPHFGREALAESLAAVDIRYEWFPELGGRRPRGATDSPHIAWTVPAFRNYADYMDTDGFAAGLARLLNLTADARVAVMCAEARYWQCHRRLIADRLTVEGHEVQHLLGTGPTRPHELPDFARVVDGRLIYDRGTQPPLL